MKMIIAFVQPFMAPRIVHALHQVPGVTGATFTDVQGLGRGRPSDVPTAEVITGTAAKMRIEVMIDGDAEDAVVKAIQDAAHTGNRGDGKIYVAPLARAVRISTGEQGDAAV